MTESPPLAPDQRAVIEHLKSARFQQGVDAGQWQVLSLQWPTMLIGLHAAPRDGAPDDFVLCFDLSGYPQAAPTAGLWDMSSSAYMGPERRPKGDRATTIFRGDWENGRALYAPYDRVALSGHGEWAQKHPQHAWNATRDLSFYLENVSEVLNADDYAGV